MLSGKDDIPEVSSVSHENKKSEISTFNSHTSIRHLPKFDSILTTKRDVSFGKSRNILNDEHSIQTSVTVKDSGTVGNINCASELKHQYDESSRHFLLLKNGCDSNPQIPPKNMDTFISSVDTAKRDVHDAKISDPPAKRRYFSSEEDMESPQKSKKNLTFSKLNKNFEDYFEISSTESPLLFMSDITIHETFQKELDRIIGGWNKENLLPTFEPVTKVESQIAVKEIRKVGCLGPKTDFQGGFAALKNVNRSPEFKIPQEKCRRGAKSVSAKTLSKSGNKLKQIKGFEGSKYKATEKVELKQSKSQNESLKNNPSLITMLDNENGSYTGLDSDLDVKYLYEFQNLSNMGALIPFEIPKAEDPAKRVTQSRSDVAVLPLSQSDTAGVPRSRSHTEVSSRSRSGTKDVSQSRNNNEDASRSGSDNKSASISEIAFLVEQRQEDYLNSLAADARRVESFISRRLEVLEHHIFYCYCELNAIPRWSLKLETVLRNLARPRSSEACYHLTVRYNSERRRPLSEIREQFLNILETVRCGMIEMLDDVRYVLSEGNIRADHSMIDKITDFWQRTCGTYEVLRLEFYNIRDDYPNFDDVCKSMDEHFSNTREIFHIFLESVIDLFESF